jgi:hypothetical protein
MKAYCHDNTPAKPGEKHGERGPTHCATITVDYEYQVEQWVIELEKYEPRVVRVECPELGREWRRNEHGKFTEVTGPS